MNANRSSALLLNGDVVPFTLPASLVPGVPGQPVALPVVKGRLYELRCTGNVRIVSGARKAGGITAEDIEVQPDAPPLRFRATAGVMSMAASSTALAQAWLVPVDEG